MGPQQQTRCCILFGAQQQRRANAGSDMLLANVGSWTQICTLHNFFSLYQALYTDFDECVEFIPGCRVGSVCENNIIIIQIA